MTFGAGGVESLLPFDRAEFRGRVARVVSAVIARRAGLLLVDQIDSLAYLTGYSHSGARYQAALISPSGVVTLLVRSADQVGARRQAVADGFVTFDDQEDEIALLARLIRDSGEPVLAVETDSHFLTIQRYERIQAEMPGLTFVDFGKVIWEHRLIKSPAEIEALRRACAIADAAVQAGTDAIAVGRSEREPAIATYRKAIQLGADNGRVAVFGYGSTVANMHGRLGQRIMQAGELYFIEAVPQVYGYSGRIARPMAVGHVSDRHRRIAERIVQIQDEFIAAMVPGAISGEIDRVARETMLREGLKKTYPQVSAYTLGYHAVPRTSDHTRIFMPNETWALEPNMVFHVIHYSEGMPFSETVLVTENGPVRLTQTPREIAVR
ncbi:aminopeptidase P family protein [Mesorhizobium sp. M00.F.Ca.ET.151.01.1.1]|nr:aminopeptidase P family protein [Mesorhizobium sp. M00.F.Ca.ET.151.01.1.1]